MLQNFRFIRKRDQLKLGALNGKEMTLGAKPLNIESSCGKNYSIARKVAQSDLKILNN